MKISDVIEAIKGAKIERTTLMKWILIGLGVVLLVLVGVWASKARATGLEHAVVTAVVTKAVTPAVVTTAVVTPTVVTTAAVPTTAAQQPSSGGGSAGWVVLAGVGVFFYAVICTSERHRNREGFFAKHCKPKWME